MRFIHKDEDMTLPKLIITADDYGMSPLFNRGIEELASLGLLTGVSVMIKRPFVDPAHLSFPDLSLGLHLELEERSCPEAINSQIYCFRKKFGKLPAYFDGHQHRHLTPHNFHLVMETAASFSLPVRSRFSEDRNKLLERNIFTPHNFISWHPNRLPTLQERIKAAGLISLSELVVHPGYFDPTCNYPYNKQRETELSFLKSPSFQELITPFELASYPAQI